MSGSKDIILSSRIPSREFHNILIRVSQKYGIYPLFKILITKNPYIDHWGIIALPRIPDSDFLHPDEKFYLLTSLGYHAISPKLEVQRIAQRFIIANALETHWKSPIVSWFSGFFSMLYTLSELARDNEMRRKLGDVLYWLSASIEKVENRNALEEFFYSFIEILRERPIIETEHSQSAKMVLEILRSNLPYEEKVRSTFRILGKFIRGIKSPKNLGRSLQQLVVPLGKPDKPDKDTWGKNKKSEKEKEKELTPQDMSRLAKIDYKRSLELAKKLDKEKEGNAPVFQKGKLPGFSERLKMYQRLAKYRRRVYEVRKIRMSEILIEVSSKFNLNFGLAPRGFSQWEINDDEELLDIESSIENFGKVIINISTLKRLYEHDREGRGSSSKHFEIIIDTSGSMDGEPLEKAIEIALALVEFAKTHEFSVALITFSSGAWEGLPPSYDYDFVEDIILRLLADGGTNLRGALKILDEHLSIVTNKPVIFFISDTAIWDISKFSVKMRIKELASRYLVYLLAITDELYDDTKKSLENSMIRLIEIPPNEERGWELILDQFRNL